MPNPIGIPEADAAVATDEAPPVVRRAAEEDVTNASRPFAGRLHPL